MTKDNNKLGGFDLSGIPPAPRGIPQIEVTFGLDSNGILTVSAIEKAGGKKQDITIKYDKGRLSEAEISRIIKEADDFREVDELQKKRIEEKNSLENFAYSVKASLRDEKISEKLSQTDKQIAEEAITEALKWLDQNSQNGTAEEFKQKREELEAKVHQIMAKLYQQSNQQSNTSPQNNPTEPKIEEVD